MMPLSLGNDDVLSPPTLQVVDPEPRSRALTSVEVVQYARHSCDKGAQLKGSEVCGLGSLRRRKHDLIYPH